jgi:hypothetical protein
MVKNYTCWNLQQAQEAHQLQNILIHPPDRQLLRIATADLANCPVTEQDVQVATIIYTPNLGSLKGKKYSIIWAHSLETTAINMSNEDANKTIQ